MINFNQSDYPINEQYQQTSILNSQQSINFQEKEKFQNTPNQKELHPQVSFITKNKLVNQLQKDSSRTENDNESPKLPKSGGSTFRISRMMRYSSNEWENDPAFVNELLRYNGLHHHDYNPNLDSKTSKMIFKKVLKVNVPKNFMEYDKRYLVKPPDSSLFLEIKRSSDIKSRDTSSTNPSSYFQPTHQRTKSQLQKLSGTNPYKLYEKFSNDYYADNHAKDLTNMEKNIEQQNKIKKVLEQYEKKLFPKSQYHLVGIFDDSRRESQERDSQLSMKADSIIENEKIFMQIQEKEKDNTINQVKQKEKKIDHSQNYQIQPQNKINFKSSLKQKIKINRLKQISEEKNAVLKQEQQLDFKVFSDKFESQKQSSHKSKSNDIFGAFKLKQEQNFTQRNNKNRILLQNLLNNTQGNSSRESNRNGLTEAIYLTEANKNRVRVNKSQETFRVSSTRKTLYTDRTTNYLSSAPHPNQQQQPHIKNQLLMPRGRYSSHQRKLKPNSSFYNSRLSLDTQGNKRSLIAIKTFNNTKRSISRLMDRCNKTNAEMDVEKAREEKCQSSQCTQILLRERRQQDRLSDIMDQRKIEKECNFENFFSEQILKKFKEDNTKMASFLKQACGFQKNKIWKPDKLILSKAAQIDETKTFI